MHRALIIFLISYSLLIFINFEYQEECQLEGEIIGWDARRCGCCEEWKIAIGEVVYLTDSIPKEILDKDPDGCSILPQKIYLDYEKETYCSSMRIKIICIKKRD